MYIEGHVATRKCVNRNVATQPYKGLALPQIDPSDVVYMTASKNSLADLQKSLNICCRVPLLADNRTNIKDMHNQLRLISFKDIQKYTSPSFAKKQSRKNLNIVSISSL